MEAIGLNPIRLDAIGIDPIRLNAIRLGVPGASSGSARPYIDPEVLASLVAVVKCDGKSNNDPDRAIIKNLVDPDNPFVISNAAYKLNSGFGKYEEDFTSWTNSPKTNTTDNKITVQQDFNKGWISYIAANGRNIPAFKVEVSGIPDGGILMYGGDIHTKVLSNGINELPERIEANAFGFKTKNTADWSKLTITQIPSFQGSFYADGVNDMITSTKTMSEMLGGGNKCTVISFITHISGAGKYNVIGNNRIQVSDYSGQSFMAGCSSKSGEKIVELGDKEKIQAFQYNTFDSKLSIGSLESGLEISSYAYYGTFVFNKDSVPIDWIHQVIAYFYLDKYVTPGIIYDTIRQGITNENHASFNDELVDFSGNGHNLKIYNSAWKLGSGIGKYNEDFETWFQMTNGTAIISHDKLRVNKVSDINGGNFIAWKLQSEIKAFKAKITGIPKDANIFYLYSKEGSVRESIIIDTDGEYDIPYSHPYASGVGFTINSNFPKEAYIGVTIEQIPDYEGALVFDAVEDYGQFVGDLGLKDYTVAVDRAYPRLNVDSVPVVSNITRNNITPFLFEYANADNTKPYSFGTKTDLSPMELSRKISYQSTYSYNGINITKGTNDNTGQGLTIGRFGGDQQYSNLALWSLLLFPYTLSEFLLERQLKRYKLGTLYPDMVEFRPILNSNVDIDKYLFINKTTNKQLNIGDYFAITDTIEIQVYLTDKERQEITSLTINGKEFTPMFIDIRYLYNIKNFGEVTGKKSPQKINIAIDEYIHYEDIVQPYPFIIPIIDTDGKEYTYGDKIKVGTEIRGGINGNNLLPELYKLNGYFNFNGAYFSASNKHVIGKTNVFELTNAPTYLKANEPNCIADPQRLRIPNSSYKILGYIPDISGHGNHLKINNSAYAGMSGANGYVEDFTTWGIYGGMYGGVILTDSTIKTNSDFRSQDSWVAYKGANKTLNSFSVNITGIPKEGILNFRVNADTYIELSNGRNDLSFDNLLITVSSGFRITKGSNLDWSNLVIQQIGEYEGSFCLDGVEDYLTIPTLSHGAKQVLMKVRSFKPVCTIYEQRTPTGVDGGWIPTFCIFMNNQSIAYVDGNNGNTYIDGILNTSIQGNQLVDITHNITVTNENTKFGNTQSPLIGKLATSNTLYAQMALFAFMSFDDISSEEEIKELNDIVGIEGGYVESPDYYWDAYGKANTATQDIDYLDLNQASNANKVLIDKSKAGLAALELYHNSGNNSELINRRLNLNNFAFNEESGYGGWLGIGDLTNALNYRGNSTTNNWKRGGTFLKDIDRNNKTGCGYAYAAWFDSTNHILKFKIKITGLTDADELYICQYNIIDPEIKQQLFNGINEVTLDLSASIEPTYQYISFRYPPLTNNVDFEFLYEYQNGLVSDGVNDNLKNTNMPVLTDYTWIMKRKRLNDKGSTTLCHKGNGSNSNAFLFEIIEGTTKTRSFGTDSTVVFPDLISWQTKNSYNGQTIASGTSVDGNVLHIFMGSNVYPYYTKAVFYKAMLYSKTIDMLSINMLKNLFEKDELIDVNNPIFKQNN